MSPESVSPVARAGAAAIDLLVAATPAIVSIPLLFTLYDSGQALDSQLSRALALYLFAGCILIHLCHVLGQMLFGAETLGRRLCSLELVDRMGESLGIGRRMLRMLAAPVAFALAAITGLWPLLALWPATALVFGRGPADLLAGSSQSRVMPEIVAAESAPEPQV